MSGIRQRLTYANVVASLALFIALGGSSYAAVQLSKNSVRSKHIKNGQVKRADLGKSAVDSTKVKDGSLLSGDFASGQLMAGATGPKGDPGPQGLNGAPGEPGSQGAPGMSGYERVLGAPATDDDNDVSASAGCPQGKKAVGGGFGASRVHPSGFNTVPVNVYHDRPSESGNSWQVRASFDPNGPLEADKSNRLTVFAVCVTVAE